MAAAIAPQEDSATGLPDHLREEAQHDIHHHQGDVGGRYHGQGESYVAEQYALAAQRTKEEDSLGLDKESGPVFIVVMGVSACGKSTVGAGLAHVLGLPFIDADDLHPKANVDKMSRGEPLTDEDRQPWLAKIRTVALQTCEDQLHDEANHGGATGRGIVVGCSALKRSYRDILRGNVSQDDLEAARDDEKYDVDKDVPRPYELPTYFVHISGSKEALRERIRNRKGHFMKEQLLDSQLATLEPPGETGEPNVAVIHLEQSVDEQIREAVTKLKGLGLKTVKKGEPRARLQDEVVQ